MFSRYLFFCIRFSLRASDNIFLPVLFQRHGEKLSYSWPSILHMLRCHCYSFIPWYMFLFDIYWLLTYIFSSRVVTDASEKDLISLGFQVKLLNYSLLCLARYDFSVGSSLLAWLLGPVIFLPTLYYGKSNVIMGLHCSPVEWRTKEAFL